MFDLSIHGSFERNRDIIPEGVVINEHPWDGKPFSHYYILSKDNKECVVYFGCGGNYPDRAKELLEEYFT